MKSIQELAKEHSYEYDTEEERKIAFDSFVAGFKEGYKGKHRDDWDLSFCREDFAPIMFDWLGYKKERKESYKSQKSIIACYRKLFELSDGNADVAVEIINQSMANNWAGLFQLKDNGNGKRTGVKGGQRQSGYTIFDAAESVLAEDNFQP